MKAEILPLHGKYYGTKVCVVELGYHDGYDGDGLYIKIWAGGRIPSERQLADWGCTEAQASDDDMMCDSHYETQMSYDIAKRIADALTDP